ncbi:MAG TPA: hypothetical protein VHQ03_00095 [Candidatus Dormibacteraeota bacterium]|jgi:hypothetical protein|nr:hypothetical protein [Candidatus Dormibacteraeota bacterium]
MKLLRLVSLSLLAVALLPTSPRQLRAQKPDSAQFAQMQGMMGPMMEQMMTAGMTATLKVLAKPESAQQLATFVKNFYDALIAKGFTKDDALKIVMAVGMPHPAGGR